MAPLSATTGFHPSVDLPFFQLYIAPAVGGAWCLVSETTPIIGTYSGSAPSTLVADSPVPTSLSLRSLDSRHPPSTPSLHISLLIAAVSEPLLLCSVLLLLSRSFASS